MREEELRSLTHDGGWMLQEAQPVTGLSILGGGGKTSAHTALATKHARNSVLPKGGIKTRVRELGAK